MKLEKKAVTSTRYHFRSMEKTVLSSSLNATPEKTQSKEVELNSNDIGDHKSIENGDDVMMDLSDVGLIETPVIKPAAEPTENRKLEVKPLTDVSVTLESIKPSNIPPINVIEEKNGITVMLNFAKDTPREDVSVIVVTTLSKNPSPVTNYLLQAVVPKVINLL